MKGKNEKQPKQINPESLGILEPNFDPMRTIGMEIAFYRGMASTHHRHLIIRLLSILFGLYFVVQSIAVFVLVFVATDTEQVLPMFFATFLSFLLLLLGLKIIYMNLRHKNRGDKN